MTSNVVLKAEGVRKCFGSAEVLRGIDFVLYASEVVAIMGPSGSGKSTLLHCLAGIIQSDKGEVFYKGVDISKLSQDALAKLRRNDFGFVFQFGELVPELPILENVALPLLLNGHSSRQAYDVARHWLDYVGLAAVVASMPGVLSGGELQRAAIARAMAINPSVIFADEPTGSLDSVNSNNVMRLFVALAKQYQKSVVIVTHSAELAAYADRIILMRDGQEQPNLASVNV